MLIVSNVTTLLPLKSKGPSVRRKLMDIVGSLEMLHKVDEIRCSFYNGKTLLV